jgi:hypothetical protein
MKKKKYIAFVGDSFCATYNRNNQQCVELNQSNLSDSAYTGIVSDHYGCNVAPYGWGGKSWWFSWNRFWKDWEFRLDELEAIVFTHTDYNRINSSDPDLPLMANYSAGPDYLVHANQEYFKYIHDRDFNIWAQEQYFKLLKEKVDKIKTVHLLCFTDTINKSHLLPGVVFITPLMHISIGEVRGSQKQILRAMNDQRANHLNDYNNRILADTIIHALDNYTPGQYPLPVEKFEQHNPNARYWPTGVYWTKG